MNLEKYVLAPVGAELEVKNGLDETFGPGMYVTLYCPRCKGLRNFRFHDNDQTNRGAFGVIGAYRHRYDFYCDCGIRFEVTFAQFKEKYITKVGQHPNLIIFDPGLNSEAMQSMTAQQKKDYLNAVESHNNGLDVGAFEYLRRAFVCMVDEAKERFLEENPRENDSKGNFKNIRNEIKEVIRKLVKEDKLDAIFLETGFTIIYPLLSDGVHNKSNEECAKYYDVLKEGIELIARRNYELQERQKRVSTLSKALGRIPSEQEKTKNVLVKNRGD